MVEPTNGDRVYWRTYMLRTSKNKMFIPLIYMRCGDMLYISHQVVSDSTLVLFKDDGI